MPRLLPTATLGFALVVPRMAEALDLVETGSWSLLVSASDLVSGAGSGLQSAQNSASSQVVLDVALSTGSTDAWRLDVRRVNSTWDSATHVWVRRTGGGSGTGSITGGTSWVEVTTTDTVFFEGAGDRDAIPLQLRVTGLSLSVNPDAYLTTLQYTLVDTV